jgi:hypothetical protein
MFTRYETLSGGSSDFPPIRERKSTPDQLSSPGPTCDRLPSSPVLNGPSEQCSSPSSDLQPSQPRKLGLGAKNQLNTVNVTEFMLHTTVRHLTKTHKLLY